VDLNQVRLHSKELRREHFSLGRAHSDRNTTAKFVLDNDNSYSSSQEADQPSNQPVGHANLQASLHKLTMLDGVKRAREIQQQNPYRTLRR
jgi:hypothetical protein